jgi:hypothetical protein
VEKREFRGAAFASFAATLAKAAGTAAGEQQHACGCGSRERNAAPGRRSESHENLQNCELSEKARSPQALSEAFQVER